MSICERVCVLCRAVLFAFMAMNQFAVSVQAVNDRSAAESKTVIEHVGDSDPAEGEWDESFSGDGNVVPVIGEPEAWNINTLEGGSRWYRWDNNMTGQQLLDAHGKGFVVTVKVRLNGTFPDFTGARVFANLPTRGWSSVSMDMRFGTDETGEDMIVDVAGGEFQHMVEDKAGEFVEFRLEKESLWFNHIKSM